MNCPVGTVEYAGYCVPSYYTDEEKAEYVAAQKANKAKTKKEGKIWIIAGVAVVVLAVAATFLL